MLNFLRGAELNLPDSFGETKQLRQEADFYQIAPMIEALDAWESSPLGANAKSTSHKNGWFVEILDTNQSGAKIIGSISFIHAFVDIIHERFPCFWRNVILGINGYESINCMSTVHKMIGEGHLPVEERTIDLLSIKVSHRLYLSMRMTIGEALRELGCELLLQTKDSKNDVMNDKWFVPFQALLPKKY